MKEFEVIFKREITFHVEAEDEGKAIAEAWEMFCDELEAYTLYDIDAWDITVREQANPHTNNGG